MKGQSVEQDAGRGGRSPGTCTCKLSHHVLQSVTLIFAKQLQTKGAVDPIQSIKDQVIGKTNITLAQQS